MLTISNFAGWTKIKGFFKRLLQRGLLYKIINWNAVLVLIFKILALASIFLIFYFSMFRYFEVDNCFTMYATNFLSQWISCFY